LVFHILLTIIGLSVFEIVNSLDNAVINASVLETIKLARARRFFVTWGMISSVGLVRGVMPFIIYFIPNRQLGLYGAVSAFWTGDPRVAQAVADAAPLLLLAGGIFLVLLFLHWLLAEEKSFGLPFESLLQEVGEVWFYAAAAALLLGVIMLVQVYGNLSLAVAATSGFTVFFIAEGFKHHAEEVEQKLREQGEAGQVMSDWSKVLFLEVIDATFSIDGVVGAFAFTMMVPFILIGNGLGAYVVRRLTLSNVDRISDYDLLKNGAMYSIGLLGMAMVAEGFKVDIPSWWSPLVTFGCVGFFLAKSILINRAKKRAAAVA
jgi:uncharacterized protein